MRQRDAWGETPRGLTLRFNNSTLQGGHMTPKKTNAPFVNQRATTRRDFLKTAVVGSLAYGAAARTEDMAASAASIPPAAFQRRKSKAETLVASFHRSLTEAQKQVVAFDFNHPLQSKVDNNWRITRPLISEFFTRDQQAMVEEIFRSVHNPAYIKQVMRHIEDDGGNLGNYAVALFGQPGTGQFEFVLTGRHCTMRCDGDSVDGAAFGGPIFYGHDAGGGTEKAHTPRHGQWYQGKRANEVFNALDGKQRARALLGDPRREQATQTVEFKKRKEELAGLPVAELSRDQKELVEKVLSDLLLPFRREDVDEALRYIKKRGGVDSLSLSFYSNLDLGNDNVWDVWQLESQNMLWFFRGHPHVHVWVNIRS